MWLGWLSISRLLRAIDKKRQCELRGHWFIIKGSSVSDRFGFCLGISHILVEQAEPWPCGAPRAVAGGHARCRRSRGKSRLPGGGQGVGGHFPGSEEASQQREIRPEVGFGQ